MRQHSPPRIAVLRRVSLWRWLLPLTALLATAGYLIFAYTHGLIGFPLDDAWIHQTYGRNLAETGQLAYLPGQPSAGSTSPAWSFLLSVGYLLGVDYRLWAHLLGALALAASAWFTSHLFLRLSPSRTTAALLAGLLCATEWHLVWAAASGMETTLFIALSLALLDYFFSHVGAASDPATGGPASLKQEQTIIRAIGIGLLAGILTLTRPEGLGLAGLVVGASAILPLPQDRQTVRQRLLAAGASLIALAIILAPYVAFNLNRSGSVFPNTFYAKQAEYRVQLQALPLPLRFWQVLSPTLIGAQVLLVPGFCFAIYRLLRDRRWPALLPLLWWLAFLSVYALRLPASYQHGRYSMPSIPLLILYGSWGTAVLLQPYSSHLGLRVLSRAAPPAIGLLALLFLVRGAFAYRDDVGFIQGEMVATARWLAVHTAPGELIAVHDIGAVGYLTDRPLLDLAGLITPEVIPFIDDADRLAGWVVQHGTAYAVFFPDFSPTYVRLAADPRFLAVYCTGYGWTQTMGHQNMCIYRLTPKGTP
jgi:arabinofuranosyltransferase